MHIESSKNGRRILLITTRADHGGGPRHILDLLRVFANRDYDFYIGSPEQEPYSSQFHKLTKKFFEIPPRSFSFFALFRLVHAVHQAQIDIIHSHGRGAGVYSRLLGMITKRPILHTFHGIHRDPSFIGRIKLWIDRALAYLPFTPVFVSANERREALEFATIRKNRPGYILENAVDLTRFTPRKTQPLLDPSKEICFGAFTRPDQVKGPDLLLELAMELKNEGAWKVAGLTVEELAKFGKIPADLEVIGRMDDPAAWLQDLDIFVSTARNEGLPLGVLEAMAAGCICFLSDIPAHQEFKRQNAVLLFDPKDPQSFLSELNRLKSDPILRTNLLASAHFLLTTRHSLKNFGKQLEGIYEEF